MTGFHFYGVPLKIMGLYLFDQFIIYIVYGSINAKLVVRTNSYYQNIFYSLKSLSRQSLSSDKGVTEKSILFKVFQQVSYVTGVYIRTSETYFFIFFYIFRGPSRGVNSQESRFLSYSNCPVVGCLNLYL